MSKQQQYRLSDILDGVIAYDGKAGIVTENEAGYSVLVTEANGRMYAEIPRGDNAVHDILTSLEAYLQAPPSRWVHIPRLAGGAPLAEARFTLPDSDDPAVVLCGSVQLRQSGFIEFLFDGYGDYESEPGKGTPLIIEYREQRLVAHAYADINDPEPTHTIDLTNALESKRNDG